jgi:putative aldouronate transport system permease protein
MVEKKNIFDRFFDTFNFSLLFVLTLLFAYPMLHVLMASFSDPAKLLVHIGPLFKPTGFSLEGYRIVLKNPNVLSGYQNTIIYVVAGTMVNIFMTSLGAYVLSRPNLMCKKIMTIAIVFTMYFSGGLIPNFLLIRALGMYNTRWALIIPGAIATWNLIVMKTSFQQIPSSLEESAKIDGANDFIVLFRIIMPVAKATVAVMILFYAVGHWNAWFNAMIYLRKRELWPLQLLLREILIANSSGSGNVVGAERVMDDSGGVFLLDELIKYATIIIATVPILCAYPFAQRYFMKGVMMGSLKE